MLKDTYTILISNTIIYFYTFTKHCIRNKNAIVATPTSSNIVLSIDTSLIKNDAGKKDANAKGTINEEIILIELGYIVTGYFVKLDISYPSCNIGALFVIQNANDAKTILQMYR